MDNYAQTSDINSNNFNSAPFTYTDQNNSNTYNNASSMTFSNLPVLGIKDVIRENKQLDYTKNLQELPKDI